MDKEKQKQKLIEIMEADEKDGLYDDEITTAAKDYANTHADVSDKLTKYLVRMVFEDGARWYKDQIKTIKH